LHLHINVNRIDMEGNVNDAHFIYERAMRAANTITARRGWVQAKTKRKWNIDRISQDCINALKRMKSFDWKEYERLLKEKGYELAFKRDEKGQIRGYTVRRGNSVYKSSDLGHSRGLTPSRIEEIATVPYDRLLAAYDAAMKKVVEEAKEDGAFPVNFLDAILFGQVPVVDGEIIPSLPGTAEALALSKDVPVIIGTVYHEFTRDQEDPIFKPLALQQAQDRASAGCAPVYMYQFTWESPVLDGALGSTHCLEIPFVFDNVLLHRTFTGGGDDAVELGHRVSRAWTNFAKTGVPSAEGLPEWEAYPKTLIINIKSELI
jgi:hypothetical protein